MRDGSPGSAAAGRRRGWAPRGRAERPRLVLLDLMLPDVDGIELMRQVPELADLPVIFISAYGREETVAKALDSGAADYIAKPFSATELVARVRAALRRREEPAPLVLGAIAIDYRQRRVDSCCIARPRSAGTASIAGTLRPTSRHSLSSPRLV